MSSARRLSSSTTRMRALSICRAEINLLQTARELALDAGALFKLLDLPFDRRLKSQIIQNLGAQFGGDFAHGGDDGIHMPGQFLELFLELLQLVAVADFGHPLV